jgi:hypothetical protein
MPYITLRKIYSIIILIYKNLIKKTKLNNFKIEKLKLHERIKIETKIIIFFYATKIIIKSLNKCED